MQPLRSSRPRNAPESGELPLSKRADSDKKRRIKQTPEKIFPSPRSAGIASGSLGPADVEGDGCGGGVTFHLLPERRATWARRKRAEMLNKPAGGRSVPRRYPGRGKVPWVAAGSPEFTGSPEPATAPATPSGQPLSFAPFTGSSAVARARSLLCQQGRCSGPAPPPPAINCNQRIRSCSPLHKASQVPLGRRWQLGLAQRSCLSQSVPRYQCSHQRLPLAVL